MAGERRGSRRVPAQLPRGARGGRALRADKRPGRADDDAARQHARRLFAVAAPGACTSRLLVPRRGAAHVAAAPVARPGRGPPAHGDHRRVQGAPGRPARGPVRGLRDPHRGRGGRDLPDAAQAPGVQGAPRRAPGDRRGRGGGWERAPRAADHAHLEPLRAGLPPGEGGAALRVPQSPRHSVLHSGPPARVVRAGAPLPRPALARGTRRVRIGCP
mmetsp:Transcript_18951/g.63490  ORF Transcript_18951/g.63490 Transcript_18951/m.63490 type:complete len:216 (+) Transcript_18951:208-855(+)